MMGYAVKEMFDLPVETKWPYGCLTVSSKSGRNVCLPGRKYGTPSLFRLFCPDLSRDTCENCFCELRMYETYDRWRPSWLRLLAVGTVLCMVWSGTGYLTYCGLRAYLPSQTKAALKAIFMSAKASEPKNVNPQQAKAEDRVQAEAFVKHARELYANGNVSEAILEYRNATRKDPGRADAHFEYGRCLAEIGRIRGAIDAFEIAAAADPKHWQARLFLARTHLRLGYFEQADAYATAVLEAAPDQPEAHLIRGICLRAAGDAATAEKQVERALSHDIVDPQTWLMAATYFYQIGAHERSAASYNESLRLDPDLVDAEIGLSYLLGAQSDFGAALKRIRPVIDANPTNVKAGACLAEILMMEGKIDAAIAAYERIRAHDDEPPFMTRIRHAELLIKSGKTDNGVEILKDILNRDADNMSAHLLLANLYLRLQLYSSGVEHANRILRVHPGHIRARKTLARLLIAQQRFGDALSVAGSLIDENSKQLDVLMIAALAHYRLGDTNSAVATYQVAAEAFPQSILPLLKLSEIYRESGAVEKSMSTYRQVLAIAPDDPLAGNNLAMLLLDTDHGVAEALTIGKRLRERFPTNPSVADTYGWAHFRAGDYEAARHGLEDAVRLSPQNPTFLYHLGMAMAKLNDTVAAKRYLNRALEISDDFDHAGETRQALSIIDGS